MEHTAQHEHFADRLQAAIDNKQNPTVMGLDPVLSMIPESILAWSRKEANSLAEATTLALFTFNRRLIDAVADLIPAVKPQFAYYEQYGVSGMRALEQTISYARQRGLLVIADAKRNDIGSTAAAYSRGLIGRTEDLDGTPQTVWQADAVTLNGYLGTDGIAPFLDDCRRHGKGVFILVRTSNPSAGDLQDLPLQDGRLVYEAMADLVRGWGQDLRGQSGLSSVGAVVGATWPEQAAALRRRMQDSFFLVPGYGAQGGTADAAVAGFNADGKGAIVNASRSLMQAWQRWQMTPEQFDLACRQEATEMKTALNQALERLTDRQHNLSQPKKEAPGDAKK